MKKLIRVTTADISLEGLLQGQLRFLNQYFEVVGLAADTGSLSKVAEREGIRTIDVPMHREISLIADLKCLDSCSGLLLILKVQDILFAVRRDLIKFIAFL